ncbi:MAG: hypothetical protein LJE97_12685 [Betaproteobacteria bacterium]|nr:hypothetical protein [Betaproteobacteria bacterium]
MERVARFSLVIAAFVGTAVAADQGSAVPGRLSDTGLYIAGSQVVRSENVSYSPQYLLWSDGTTKRRRLYLPPGASIDASRPDVWVFPPGTRLWKEFSHARPVETVRTFTDTIRTGRHMGRGRPVLPPMPIRMYKHFTDPDLEAIFAYLQSIPAVKNRVPEPLPPAAAAN